MGEFELIRRYFTRPPGNGPRMAQLGVGDDCALLDVRGTLAVSTDMLVEGRHFLPDVDPEALGHKCLAVNLSDLAAVGAEPLAWTLAIALPEARARDEAWLDAFARGMFALGDRYGCELVGGDTTAGPLTISITVLGRIGPGAALLRGGARVGDDIYVSGELGSAALALRAMQGGIVLESAALHLARERLERPEPRVALGRALRGIATGAIDISDGLAGDLTHILDASKVGAVVDLEQIPMTTALAACDETTRYDCALAGGDDYELCFTASSAVASQIQQAARTAGVVVTRIGGIVAESGLRWQRAGGPVAIDPHGFDHFA